MSADLPIAGADTARRVHVYAVPHRNADPSALPFSYRAGRSSGTRPDRAPTPRSSVVCLGIDHFPGHEICPNTEMFQRTLGLCAPELSAGTSTAPRLSVSCRIEVMSSPPFSRLGPSTPTECAPPRVPVICRARRPGSAACERSVRKGAKQVPTFQLRRNAGQARHRRQHLRRS
jgi:hypothetical protein